MEGNVKIADSCLLSVLQFGERQYEVRRLESDSLAAVIALQDYVIDQLPRVGEQIEEGQKVKIMLGNQQEIR